MSRGSWDEKLFFPFSQTCSPTFFSPLTWMKFQMEFWYRLGNCGWETIKSKAIKNLCLLVPTKSNLHRIKTQRVVKMCCGEFGMFCRVLRLDFEVVQQKIIEVKSDRKLNFYGRLGFFNFLQNSVSFLNYFNFPEEKHKFKVESCPEITRKSCKHWWSSWVESWNKFHSKLNWKGRKKIKRTLIPQKSNELWQNIPNTPHHQTCAGFGCVLGKGWNDNCITIFYTSVHVKTQLFICYKLPLPLSSFCPVTSHLRSEDRMIMRLKRCETFNWEIYYSPHPLHNREKMW